METTLTRFYQKQTSTFEQSYIVEVNEPLSDAEIAIVSWLMKDPSHFGRGFGTQSFIKQNGLHVVELGTRPNFVTDASSKMVAICNAFGIKKISRIELFRRHAVENNLEEFARTHHNRMTESWYSEPFTKLTSDKIPVSVRIIPVLEKGMDALIEINKELRLKLDSSDLEHIHSFCVRRNLNPTDVSLFHYAQGNSEHSRHHRMKGLHVIDGITMPRTLMDLIQLPNKLNRGQSLIAFSDDASAQRGGNVTVMVPMKPGEPSQYIFEVRTLHPTCKVETHNAPCLVEPFQGAMTGIGGIWRDILVLGIGGKISSGGFGICTDNLFMDWCEIPGEIPVPGFVFPEQFAAALEITVRGSNGGARYMNESGVPLTHGFYRTFGQLLPGGEHQAYIKPIFQVSADGFIDDRHSIKGTPKPGMLICMMGGEALPIGLGGASMSSGGQKSEDSKLDFDSVQNGNPETKRKIIQVMHTFVDMGVNNPIIKPGDQGAGGPANILTELLNPVGGRVELRNIRVGDKTMSVMQIWCAEYQERIAIIIEEKNKALVQSVCDRERVPLEFLGVITGDGKLVLYDETDNTNPVDFVLEDVLGKLPQKTYHDTRIAPVLKPLVLPPVTTKMQFYIEDLVRSVLLRPSVGSKRHFTDKCDRSVGGCVRLQPCVGPLQTPVADAGITAYSMFDTSGSVRAFGENPIGMLVDNRAITMGIAEMLMNMCCAYIGDIGNVKSNVNEMLKHDSPGEAARIYDLLEIASNMFIELKGAEPDGGKDSMGLGITHDGKTIKSPTQVTFKGYAHMNDAMRFVTPDFKKPGASSVIVIDGAPGKYRLGGSALAQALGQIGDEAPRIDNASKFKAVWNAIQELVGNGEILAYHDCLGDGGLVTTLIEMAISGNTGVSISVPDSAPLVGFLFSQECRALIECDTLLVNKVLAILEHHNVHAYTIGITTKKREITITHDTAVVFHQPTAVVRSEWERISDSISQSPDQMNTRLVPLLFMHHSADVPNIPYNLPFAPRKVTALGSYVPKAIVLREEGVNGHIEMAAAHKYLGFDTYDITMSDLLAGKIDDLSDFRYLLLSGGFSFGDVFGSGKGWAAMFRFNPKLAKMLQSFIERDDTLITGVCNGFQVMTTLGLFTPGIPEECWPQLVRNNSEKFESQYPLLAVGDAPNLPIIMNGMEGMIAPGIVAHGDGKLIIPPSEFREDIEKQVALRYVDYDGNPTNYYPCNPNGSANGSTALTSPNKRNAGMMPHLIDRMFLKDQWPYMPEEWRIYAESPWLMLGINARDWLVQNR